VPSFLSDRPHGCVLSVRVTLRAGLSAITGAREDALLVRLAAAPVDGAANDALIDLIGQEFGVARRTVTLEAGARSRNKRLSIAGLSAADAARRLQAFLSR
jgi:uncharacterized protein (TIGR00251 family)